MSDKRWKAGRKVRKVRESRKEGWKGKGAGKAGKSKQGRKRKGKGRKKKQERKKEKEGRKVERRKERKRKVRQGGTAGKGKSRQESQ